VKSEEWFAPLVSRLPPGNPMRRRLPPGEQVPNMGIRRQSLQDSAFPVGSLGTSTMEHEHDSSAIPKRLSGTLSIAHGLRSAYTVAIWGAWQSVLAQSWISASERFSVTATRKQSRYLASNPVREPSTLVPTSGFRSIPARTPWVLA